LGWVNAAPDGYTRALVGINGQWPCPAITANIGDTIKINLVNNLGNETTALHFHGLHQGNTTFDDGAAMVSQCPIAPGESELHHLVNVLWITDKSQPLYTSSLSSSPAHTGTTLMLAASTLVSYPDLSLIAI
jgi:hypothetical protein